MASDSIEKPNLRPTKLADAHGKSLGKCNCMLSSWRGSTVYTTWNNPNENIEKAVVDEFGPFNIQRSLEKRKRWELLDEFEQDDHSTSARPHGTRHVEIRSYLSERFRKQTRNLLKMELTTTTDSMDDIDITYTLDFSTRKKPMRSVRTNHRNRFWNDRNRHNRLNFARQQISDDLIQSSSDDDNDDSFELLPTRSEENQLQLKDFMNFDAKSQNESCTKQSSPQQENYKGKLYYEYIPTRTNQISKSVRSESKSRPFMPLSFRSVALDKIELAHEYLSKTYGKNFIDAQCSPTRYLICLTDRLKSLSWQNKLDQILVKSYLIIVLDENTETNEKLCHGQVALNIDLNVKMFELTNLLTSEEKIYRVEELIEKAIDLLMELPARTFKPLDFELSQRRLAKNRTDAQLSDIEFINKQIRSLTHQNDFNNSICEKPTTCPICYQDTNDMTALKTCGHWLCNDCWKEYLQISIERVKLIVCPEWNCRSAVDAGTILSLVNVHYLNIYERLIEKCLLNSSRSYVQCPLESCLNIISIADSSTFDCVRCRCGYEFCRACRQEAHFPATCRSYRIYSAVAKHNGDFLNKVMPTETIVTGRKCVSCNNFVEKNGGCDHMTCRCGAEFCWHCGESWSDHWTPLGVWKCPNGATQLQERVIIEDTKTSKHLYASAIYHRQQRIHHMQRKLKEDVIRLIDTIPLDDDALSDSVISKAQVDRRQALLEQCFQFVEYMKYLHRICEFASVSAQGYFNEPKEFFNSLQQFELILLNFEQIFDSGRGYSSIEQLCQLYERSEVLLQRLRHAVRLRRKNYSGYFTS